jgi:hypothetical protein
VLLVAIDPSGEGHEQHLQGVDIGRHGPIVPCLIPDPVRAQGRPSFRTLRAQGGVLVLRFVITVTFSRVIVTRRSAAVACARPALLRYSDAGGLLRLTSDAGRSR